MREIKFRAKDCETGKWLYGSLIQRMGYFPGILHPIATDDGKIRYIETCVDKETICQSTELIGEYDREIFEGDIVDWTFFYNRIGPNGGCIETDIQLRGVIKWSNGGFVFEVWRNDFEDAGWYGISALNFDPSSDIEVIGNIYDNPDLVEL